MLTLEICLEPCLSGFDVGIYEVSRTGHPELIEPKRQAHSTDHRLATKMALAIANELYSGYSADNQRITQPEGL